MNVIDRLIGLFSPTAALRRSYARDLLRAYDAALSDRRAARRKPINYSPEETSRAKRQGILYLSRDLDRNNGWASGLFNAVSANVVGDGIIPEIRLRRPRKGELLESVNSQLEDDFRFWADKADITGRDSWWEMQNRAYRETWVAGEILLVFRTLAGTEARGRKIPLAIQLYEAEQISDLEQALMNGVRIVQGIEMDELGRVLAYHVWPNHPSELRTVVKTPWQTIRIPADQCIHLTNTLRVSSPRGIGRIHSVANAFSALAQYLDFELTRARISSAWALLWKRSTIAMPGLKSAVMPATDANENPLLNLEGGMVLTGGPDDSLESASPAFTNNSFESFVVLCLHHCAAGLNVSYEVLARDYSRTTFSSARQSSLEDIKQWRPQQRSVIRKLCNPTFERVAKTALVVGLSPWARFAPEMIPVEWRTPGWDWIDPAKEVAADIQAVGAGFVSPQQIAAARGSDYYQVIDEIAQAQQYAKDQGVELMAFQKQAPAAPSGGQDAGTNGETAPEDGKADQAAQQRYFKIG